MESKISMIPHAKALTSILPVSMPIPSNISHTVDPALKAEMILGRKITRMIPIKISAILIPFFIILHILP